MFPTTYDLPPITYLALRCLTSSPATHYQALRGLLFVPRLHAFLLAPRTHDVAATTCAATVRVIDGVHHFATHTRATSLPARLAGLAPRLELVLLVSHDADRRQAAAMHHAHLG